MIARPMRLLRCRTVRLGGSNWLCWLSLLCLPLRPIAAAASPLGKQERGSSGTAPAAAGRSCFPLGLSPVGAVAPSVKSAANRLLQVAAARYRKGVASNDRWSLQRAFDALDLAFTLRQSPEFVLNMAQVQRHLDRCEQALCLYEAYLSISDSPEGRELATHHIGELAECPPSVAPTSLARNLEGDKVRLWASSPWHAMREAVPVGLALADVPSSQEPPQGSAPLFLALGAGLATTWATAEFARAFLADRDVARLRPEDPTIDALRSKGHAAQTRARFVGSAALGLGVLAAVGYWWESSEAPRQLPVSSDTERRTLPLMGADLGLSFAASF